MTITIAGPIFTTNAAFFPDDDSDECDFRVDENHRPPTLIRLHTHAMVHPLEFHRRVDLMLKRVRTKKHWER